MQQGIYATVLAKYYTLRLKRKTWFVGSFVNLRDFFTVVIIIVIIIIIIIIIIITFALQREFPDDSLWIGENHALN